MDAMRRDDDWQNTEAKSCSVKKIKQNFPHCSPRSAQDVEDVNGWKPREHIA